MSELLDPERIVAARTKSEPFRDRHVLNGVVSRRDCETIRTIARIISMTAAAITKGNVHARSLSAGTAIHTLAMDAVQQAKSGHPGTPMALAPLAYVIWQHFVHFGLGGQVEGQEPIDSEPKPKDAPRRAATQTAASAAGQRRHA
jgi:hypothetical protein